MRNNLISIIILFLIVSCSDKDKSTVGDVKLELLNSEIQYAAIDSNLLLITYEAKYDELKSYSKAEREKAYNLLTYKISNNSNKKYFFVFNPNSFGFLGNSYYFEKGGSHGTEIISNSMTILIDGKNNFINDVGIVTGRVMSSKNDSLKIYLKKYKELKKNMDKDNYEDYGDKELGTYMNGNLHSKSFVLHPGEYKIFKKKLYLPIFEEKDRNSNLSWFALSIPANGNHEFRLGVKFSKNLILKDMVDYQKKEIEDNGYEIFDGELLSNKVPLKINK